MLDFLAKVTLSVPLVYDTYQSLVGGAKGRRRFVTEYVRPQPGENALDIGCGTGACIGFLPRSIALTGYDISPAYIREAQSKHGDRGKFLVKDATLAEGEWDGPFDVAYSWGILHHITDEQVAALARNVLKMLKPGGRYVTLDPCFTSPQHPIARYLIEHDRGKFIRPPDQLRALFGSGYSGSYVIDTDMLRVPYTCVIMTLTRIAP